MYRLIMRKQAEKQLRTLPRRDQKRIWSACEEVRRNPFRGKKLEGEYGGFYVARCWPYRIIYFIEKKTVTVTVVAIGHRQGVYK